MSLLLAALAIAPEPAPLTVSQVIARHEALDGKTIRVRGWLKDCQRFSCLLLANRGDWSEATLSIGPSPAFDAAVRARADSEIVVEGVVSAICFAHLPGDRRFDPMDISVCTDRADELRDPRLIAVLPPARKN